MANNPELLKMPLARDGQKSTIPETTDASTGLFSQQYGWQSINSLPPQAGGKAVKREDFNGAFNLLGGIAYYAQKGFTFNFDATQDYYAGCVVIDTTDGQKYECIADVAAGGSAPSADSTHWQLAGNNSADIDVWFRQASTVYDNGAIALLLTLPTGWYLECTGTGGTTDAGDLVITSPSVGNTVTDGTVVWTIRAVASTADIPAPVDISGKANVDLDNLSAEGEARFANIVKMPDWGNEIAVTNTANGFTYTAPADGYLKVNRSGNNADCSVKIYLGTDSSGINIGNKYNNLLAINTDGYADGMCMMLIPTKANQTYYFVTTSISIFKLSFVPFKD
jgi:hypothetical protein